MPNTLSSARNPAIHNRHSIRLPGYDYTQPGAYYLTILTHKREHLFGKVTGGVVKLSPLGEIVHEEWLNIPTHFSNVVLDAFVIMPDHMHGIVVITEGEVHTGLPLLSLTPSPSLSPHPHSWAARPALSRRSSRTSNPSHLARSTNCSRLPVRPSGIATTSSMWSGMK